MAHPPLLFYRQLTQALDRFSKLPPVITQTNPSAGDPLPIRSTAVVMQDQHPGI